VGDTIRVKDQEGVVENIGVRTTTWHVENVQVLCNAMIFAEVVANHSHAREPCPARLRQARRRPVLSTSCCRCDC